MLLVGLAGGIGTGKSTVAGMLAELGACTLEADTLARALLEPGSPFLPRVLETFPEARKPDGTLDRRALGKLVFADPDALQRLEALLHPELQARLDAGIARCEAAGAQVVVVEAAVLPKLPLWRKLDFLIWCECPPGLQIQRAQQAQGLSEAEARQRLQAQQSLLKARRAADYVLDTSKPLEEVEREISSLWQELLQRAANKRSSRRPL